MDAPERLSDHEFDGDAGSDGNGPGSFEEVVITSMMDIRIFNIDALPVLKQCGFTATIFLHTDRIQDTSARFEGADYLTWRGFANCTARVFASARHGDHPDLRSLGQDHIDYELGYSKRNDRYRNLRFP